MGRLRSIWCGTKRALSQFLTRYDAFEMAGALSFYTVLSLAPLLVLLVGVAGLVWSEDAVRGKLIAEMQTLVGPAGADVITTIMRESSGLEKGPLSMALGVLMLFIGATTVFAQLQAALNRIWDVKPLPRASAFWSYIRTRILSLGIVIALGFLLIVSLAVSAALSAVAERISISRPDAGWLWQTVNFAISWVVIAVLIALVYKVLPDVRLSWKDVWFGALVTSALLGVGKLLLGLYLGHASIGSAYGAAGSLVVLLVWVYYSSVILFFGAEITQVYVSSRGKPVVAEEHAALTTEGRRRDHTRRRGPRAGRRAGPRRG